MKATITIEIETPALAGNAAQKWAEAKAAYNTLAAVLAGRCQAAREASMAACGQAANKLVWAEKDDPETGIQLEYTKVCSNRAPTTTVIAWVPNGTGGIYAICGGDPATSWDCKLSGLQWAITRLQAALATLPVVYNNELLK